MMDDFSCLDERTTADRSRRQTDGEGGAKTDTGILVRSASADSSGSAILDASKNRPQVRPAALLRRTSGKRSSITPEQRVDPADWRRNKCAATLSGRGINMDALQRPRTLIKYTLIEIR